MMRSFPSLLALLASLGWSTPAGSQEAVASTLKVNVQAVSNDAGKVCVAVFASKDGWPSNNAKAKARACSAPKGKTANFSFENLPQGTYAAFAFHDEDSDGKIKKNFIGMPKEGVGASNNAGGIGGPSFKAASFPLSAPSQTISFSLKYL